MENHRPIGVTFELINHHGTEAVLLPLDSPGLKAAARAYAAGFGKEPSFIREGGSIPIVSLFKSVLGVDSLLVGFGLPDDNTHSPNEKFSLADYHRGIKTTASSLGSVVPTTSLLKSVCHGKPKRA